MDKRKDKRFNTQLHVKLKSGPINSWGMLCDVSESGIFIKCNRDFNLEQIIHIEIFMADNSISHLKGVLIRKIDLPETHRKNGLGIQLIEQDTHYKEFIKSLSEKIGKQLDPIAVPPLHL